MSKTLGIVNRIFFYISLVVAFVAVAVFLVSIFDIVVLAARETNEELKGTPLYNSYPIQNYIVSSIISGVLIAYFAVGAFVSIKAIDKCDLAWKKEDLLVWQILSFVFLNIPGGIILSLIPKSSFPGYVNEEETK
jgi:hypothetical protein